MVDRLMLMLIGTPPSRSMSQRRVSNLTSICSALTSTRSSPRMGKVRNTIPSSQAHKEHPHPPVHSMIIKQNCRIAQYLRTQPLPRIKRLLPSYAISTSKSLVRLTVRICNPPKSSHHSPQSSGPIPSLAPPGPARTLSRPFHCNSSQTTARPQTNRSQHLFNHSPRLPKWRSLIGFSIAVEIEETKLETNFIEIPGYSTH